MRTVHVALGIMLLAVAAAPARADGFVTPFYGYNFGGDSNCATFTSCEDKRTNFGVSIGKMGAVFGFEEDISLAKDFFGNVPNVDNSVFTLMSNLLIGVGAGPVQPYFLVGAGLIRPHASFDLTKFTTENNSLGYDLGAGVNGYFSRHVGVRGDVRRFHTLQDVNVPLLGNIASQVFTSRRSWTSGGRASAVSAAVLVVEPNRAGDAPKHVRVDVGLVARRHANHVEQAPIPQLRGEHLDRFRPPARLRSVRQHRMQTVAIPQGDAIVSGLTPQIRIPVR